MPAPTTNVEFVELVRKSGVVDEKRLDAYLEKLRAANAVPPEPGQLAGLFVRDGLLTLFQARQIVEHGKWKRFTLGKYKVLEQLGAGGMGSVYLCEHMLMRRRVAVKVLPTAKAEEPAALDRFYREARAVAALDHPNIVRAYDIDQADKLHFLVMEYVDGSSLQEIVKRTGPLDPIRAAHYIRQAALGLQHAHEQARLVHRDIKPGNILVDRNGIVKILDMGLARFFLDEEDDLTKKHDENVLGTADYLAPEQALNSHEVDIRADIYSLGATFYFCLCGRTPFAEGTVAQKLIWHQTRQPKPLKTLRPDIDPGILAVLDRMMAKDPSQRYQEPLEVAEALSPWTRTSIPPPVDAEMPRLSPAALGNTTSSPAGDSNPLGAPRLTAGVPTPSPRPSWQVATPSNPSTVRSITPPVKPAAPPPSPAPAPATRTPASATAPGPTSPAPAAAPRAQGPAVLQATPAPRPAAPQPVITTAPATEPTAAAGPSASTPQADLTIPVTERIPLRRTRGLQANRALLYAGLAALAAIMVAVAGFFIWKAVSSDDDTPPPPPKIRGAVVYEVGPDARYRTIRLVLENRENPIRPGDTIVLLGDTHNEELRIDEHEARSIKGITIQSKDPKKPVVWKPTATAKDPAYLILLNDAEDFHIRNLILDGDNRSKNLVQLLCDCRNVRLDNVEMRNFVEAGVRFTNCVATADRPVMLSRVNSKGDKSPLLFEVLSAYKNHPKNDGIIVRDDCKMEGNFKIPVRGLKPGDNKITLPKDLQAKVEAVTQPPMPPPPMPMPMPMEK